MDERGTPTQMPDTDQNKPGGGQTAGKGGSAALSIGEELDQLLAEIEDAIEELDPLGDLELAASAARQDAAKGDPDYDDVEDLFEVIEPGGGSAEEESPVPTADLDSELEELLNSVDAPEAVAPLAEDLLVAESEEAAAAIPVEAPAAAAVAAPTAAPKLGDGGAHKPDPSVLTDQAQKQIDHELDALLAEATSVLGEDTVEESGEAAAEEALNAIEPEAVVLTAPAGDAESGDPTLDAAGDDTVAEGAAARSIEEVDAELAAQATEAVELLDAAEAETIEEASENHAPEVEAPDGAFASSEDVVEQVIAEQASVVQRGDEPASVADEPGAAETADDSIAQLMVESPASEDLGVDGGVVADSAAVPEPSRAAAVADGGRVEPATISSTGSADLSIDLIGSATGVLGRMLRPLRPAGLAVARAVSKPLELVPPRVRDDIGWLALVTVFLALAVLIALVLFR